MSVKVDKYEKFLAEISEVIRNFCIDIDLIVTEKNKIGDILDSKQAIEDLIFIESECNDFFKTGILQIVKEGYI